MLTPFIKNILVGNFMINTLTICSDFAVLNGSTSLPNNYYKSYLLLEEKKLSNPYINY